MKRKKKNKLWMLQAVLCAVCILSVVLLYQNYVVIPRQNRELVEELKTCFPEDIPPGGGSPGEKEEQAGREPEVSAVDLRSLQRQYPGVRGWLTIPEVGIDYPVMQSSREDPEYYVRRDYRETTTSMEALVPPGRLYFGRIKESDYLRSQHEQRGDVRESGQVRLL